MYSKTIAAGLVFILLSCKDSDSQIRGGPDKVNVAERPGNTGTAAGNPFPEIAAIPAPEGFIRFNNNKNSFTQWLGHVRLKKSKTVYLFDGNKKRNQSAQFAVLDIPVGNKDLQQCADAVMRLRATYLYDQKKFDSIVFFDNQEKKYIFSSPYTAEHFNSYMQNVFAMCGSASLSKQLRKVNFREIQPGDVLIRSGFPGHAVIVMDVVINKEGFKKYLLAQSYMPAQDIHVLINPVNTDGSPWYDVTDEDIIRTPEYTFYRDELKRW